MTVPCECFFFSCFNIQFLPSRVLCLNIYLSLYIYVVIKKQAHEERANTRDFHGLSSLYGSRRITLSRKYDDDSSSVRSFSLPFCHCSRKLYTITLSSGFAVRFFVPVHYPSLFFNLCAVVSTCPLTLQNFTFVPEPFGRPIFPWFGNI